MKKINLKKKISISKKMKKTIAIIAAVVVVIGGGALVFVNCLCPYVISINDEPVCAVKNKSDAKSIILSIAETKAVEETELKAVVSDGAIKIELSNPLDGEDIKVVSKDEAIEMIDQSIEDSKDVKLSVASAKTEVVKYSPEPNYEKDDSLYAGQTKIKKKGKKGKRYQTTTYITEDGEVVDKVVTDGEIIEEGEKATLYKGTKGLPEGEDWKTYEGDPISPIAGDIVAKGKSFIGIPYSKWDCVDFVRNTYARMGMTLPRGHKGLKAMGVGVSYKNAKPGDVICYARHVGIYIGNGRMIHSTSKTGVAYGRVNPNKIITIRRVIP